MSKSNPNFVGLLPAQNSQPPNAYTGPGNPLSLLRDQLQISSWLCVGAIVQGAAYYLLGSRSLIPASTLILFRVLDALLITLGWKRNHYMNGVLMKKFSTQFPDSQGSYGSRPANDDLVVFLIGTRCNHPLGVLAPGNATLGQYFNQMEKDLHTHREEFGMVGMRICLDACSRSSGSEIVAICYFHTVEGLHAFAHSPYHREGWDWMSRALKKYPHLSIFHETYHVPKGNWETIYANSEPSGLASSSFEYYDTEKGENMWASPVVDASKGLLRTSAGRMSRSDATENDKYGY